ncbi:SPOR domain-containing protein [Zooshikella harenae]|uniref:SPOR domain-containing protein n=1 Tax=Zooshikella harenae TaxID=2827238 RepID=A0ABS5ZAX4_9GAMM|nr:SPOR domain-containing protein [Zooshikella harenae]MBU2711216.1 SPOR domain-containing protein [Zooshikella harenae]
MLKKSGFIMLIIFFGAVMFLLGIVSPNKVRQPILAQLSLLPAWLAIPQLISNSVADAQASSLISYESLLITNLNADVSSYTLQIGLFPEKPQADAMAQRLKHYGYQSSIARVVDKYGLPWLLVTTGSFDTQDNAKNAELSLVIDLGLSPELTILKTPPTS